MAAENPPTNHGFTHLLSSAACEWLLILLLLVNTCLSHLLARFARYCNLTPPCLLCSQLGTTYWNLFCHGHRQELSRLVSCTLHQKFADTHFLCEECLSPIIARSKLTSDTYRLLVGKSWLDVDRSVLHSLVSSKHIRLGSLDHPTCSCCGKRWKTKSSTERLLELNPTGLGASKANVKPPLPRALGHTRFSRRDSLKKLKDKFTGQIVAGAGAGINVLSHVGYTKLKISSDTESEFLFSDDGNDDDDDDDDDRDDDDGDDDGKETFLDSGEVKSVNLLGVDVFRQRAMAGAERELACRESAGKASPSPCMSPDLISLGDWPQQADMAGGSLGPSALSVLSELLSLCNVPSSPGSVSRKDDSEGTGESGYSFIEKNIEAAIEASFNDAHPSELYNTQQNNAWARTDKTTAATATATSSSSSYSPPSSTNIRDFNTKTEENDEPPCPKPGSPPTLTCPRAQAEHTTQPEASGTSSPPPSSSSPKTHEPLDIIAFEDIIKNLKRQAEHDRDLLNTLYKDLEEERNASAIAANQAMAMITRLQEEKAALHMEALQYLRMMEEQAEYDMEALGRANDTLAEKDKELQDLEIELEFYRNYFLDESGVHNLQGENNRSPIVHLGEDLVLEENNGLLSSFEEERAHILQSLKKLETKLLQEKSDLPNGFYPVRNHEGLSAYRQNGEKIVENGDEVKSSTLEKDIRELYERLGTLEADRDFVKRTCDLIRNGKDGFELVQEITRQLRDLRKMEFKRG